MYCSSLLFEMIIVVYQTSEVHFTFYCWILYSALIGENKIRGNTENARVSRVFLCYCIMTTENNPKLKTYVVAIMTTENNPEINNKRGCYYDHGKQPRKSNPGESVIRFWPRSGLNFDTVVVIFLTTIRGHFVYHGWRGQFDNQRGKVHS